MNRVSKNLYSPADICRNELILCFRQVTCSCLERSSLIWRGIGAQHVPLGRRQSVVLCIFLLRDIQTFHMKSGEKRSSNDYTRLDIGRPGELRNISAGRIIRSGDHFVRSEKNQKMRSVWQALPAINHQHECLGSKPCYKHNEMHGNRRCALNRLRLENFDRSQNET